MDVRNCKNCGQIYAYDGFDTCLRCRREDEEDFKKVKEYLDEYTGANISEVEEETGISSRKIIHFLKQGRLEVGDENNIILSCERCGTSIKSGRFCDKCKVEMEREFKLSIGRGISPKDLSDGRMKEKIKITERYKYDKK